METAYRRTRWHPPPRPEQGWFLPSGVAVFVPGFVRLMLLTASLIKSLPNQYWSTFFSSPPRAPYSLLSVFPSTIASFSSFRAFLATSNAWELQRYVCHGKFDPPLNHLRHRVSSVSSRISELDIHPVGTVSFFFFAQENFYDDF